MIEFGHLSHIGLQRSRNEDTYYGDSELKLWLVADGMGARGEMVSAITRETVVRYIRRGSTLEQAVRMADVEVIRSVQQQDNGQPMGTTVVVARLVGYEYEVVWVGDSPAYYWHGGVLFRLSADQVPVPEAYPIPKRKRDMPPPLPARNVVTQALGVTDPSQLNVSRATGVMDPGSRLLLCSDGLTEAIDDTTLSHVFSCENCTAQEYVDMLVATALEGGGKDNITAIVVQRHSPL